ncbi:MAG: DsbE family thiol:disulfide interchange protein, partial [Nevskiaceae bacterium]|nr:DsbE family thiol:disulfide interchange protein [Nevskiaceae bacterium]
MKRFFIPLGVFGALLVVLIIGLYRMPQKQVVQSALLGKPAPGFELPDLADPSRTVRFADLNNGRWSLVNVWGTWCVECRVEHPVLLQLAKQDKLNIIGLNYKDDPQAAREWLEQLGNPYTVVAMDNEGQAALDWGVYGAPETFLVNPQGVVV